MKVDGLHDSLVTSQKHKGHTKIQEQAKAERAQDRVDLATPVRVGQMVLYVSISKSLNINGHSFTAVPSPAANSEPAVEPSDDNPLGFDYKAVAKNVLGFVTGRIRPIPPWNISRIARHLLPESFRVLFKGVIQILNSRRVLRLDLFHP